jgi:hypothetical protein
MVPQRECFVGGSIVFCDNDVSVCGFRGSVL